jgi:hypothetical protein
MQITVISSEVAQATSKAGKPYNYVELAYKNQEGKIEGRKIMAFGESKDTYKTLSTANQGEVFEIRAVKNDASGYWDWVGASKSDGSAPTNAPTSARPAAGGKVVGSNYETAEERAKKQVYIVRQSSITAALSFLGGKSKSTDEVIQVAKDFEKYVFDVGSIQAPAKVDEGFADDVI